MADIYLYEPESDALRQARLGNLVQRVLHRLGDAAQDIWSDVEVRRYLAHGARELVNKVNAVWDTLYLENLPPGFNYTSAADADFLEELEGFDYGRANYTSVAEEPYIEDAEFFNLDDVQRANHTSPADLNVIQTTSASIQQRGTAQVPSTVTAVDRVASDRRALDATMPTHAEQYDEQYEVTEGEVMAYTWRKDGHRTLRKIRVPAAMADIYTFSGSWGIARDVSDTTRDTEVEGTYGIPRIVAGHHPIGNTRGFGTTRRFYQDGKNFKVEHYRHFELSDVESELPGRYFLYLAHFAQFKCLNRNGPGQNLKLAQWYQSLWDRDLKRVEDRVRRQALERLGRLGGEDLMTIRKAPPRPRLPWQYGDPVRS